MDLRAKLKESPMVGWGVAAVLFAAALGVYFMGGRGGGPEPTDEVYVLFTDTGEQVKMHRGRLERELALVPGQVDPAKGIVNPATGKASGVIVDKADWERTVATINAEKKAAAEKSKSKRSGGGNGK